MNAESLTQRVQSLMCENASLKSECEALKQDLTDAVDRCQRRVHAIKAEAEGYRQDHMKCVRWCCENGLGDSTENAVDILLAKLNAAKEAGL